MMRVSGFIACGAALALAACSQSADDAATNAAAAPKKEKTPYCFFKDQESKGWAATRGRDGNITVKGRLFRSDPRYKAVLGEPRINGTRGEFWPSITINDTGFAAPENWWELSAVIPNSSAIDTVDVRCGKKTFAEFKVARAK